MPFHLSHVNGSYASTYYIRSHHTHTFLWCPLFQTIDRSQRLFDTPGSVNLEYSGIVTHQTIQHHIDKNVNDCFSHTMGDHQMSRVVTGFVSLFSMGLQTYENSINATHVFNIIYICAYLSTLILSGRLLGMM